MIITKIKEDLLTARKARDQVRVGILSTLFSEVEKFGKDKDNQLTSDIDAITIIKKFSVNACESLSYTKDHGSASHLSDEIKIYESYLPQQLDKAQMKRLIAQCELVGFPIIMKYFKTNYAGRYDGKTLSEIAKSMV